MAVRYSHPDERFRNICTVHVAPELKEILEKWRINLSAVADDIGMKRATFGNKYKGDISGFTPDEYNDFIKSIKKMIKDIEPLLKNYPLLDE